MRSGRFSKATPDFNCLLNCSSSLEVNRSESSSTSASSGDRGGGSLGWFMGGCLEGGSTIIVVVEGVVEGVVDGVVNGGKAELKLRIRWRWRNSGVVELGGSTINDMDRVGVLRGGEGGMIGIG